MAMPRRFFSSLLFVLILPIAGIAPAHAASFDCAKASTGVEKAICADPQLSEYDERIAAAYKRNLNEWDGAIRNYVRNDQRYWLGQIRHIDRPDGEIEPWCTAGDQACLSRELHIRTDALESAGYRNSGVYLRSDGGGTLLITAIRNSDIRLRAFDRKSGKILGSADDEAKSQRTGLPELQRDTFQWDGPDTFILEATDDIGQAPADGCKLTVRFTASQATVQQRGGCGGAHLAGTYKRALDKLLVDYEFGID